MPAVETNTAPLTLLASISRSLSTKTFIHQSQKPTSLPDISETFKSVNTQTPIGDVVAYDQVHEILPYVASSTGPQSLTVVTHSTNNLLPLTQSLSPLLNDSSLVIHLLGDDLLDLLSVINQFESEKIVVFNSNTSEIQKVHDRALEAYGYAIANHCVVLNVLGVSSQTPRLLSYPLSLLQAVSSADLAEIRQIFGRVEPTASVDDIRDALANFIAPDPTFPFIFSGPKTAATVYIVPAFLSINDLRIPDGSALLRASVLRSHYAVKIEDQQVLLAGALEDLVEDTTDITRVEPDSILSGTACPTHPPRGQRYISVLKEIHAHHGELRLVDARIDGVEVMRSILAANGANCHGPHWLVITADQIGTLLKYHHFFDAYYSSLDSATLIAFLENHDDIKPPNVLVLAHRPSEGLDSTLNQVLHTPLSSRLYLASVSIYNSYSHSLQSFKAAETHSGPALVVALDPLVGGSKALEETRRYLRDGSWTLWDFDSSRPEGRRVHLEGGKVVQDVYDIFNASIPPGTTKTFNQLPNTTKTLNDPLIASITSSYQALLSKFRTEPTAHLLVLYGSDGGNAEKLAKKFGDEAKARNADVRITSCDAFLAADGVDGLNEISAVGTHVIFFISTAGQVHH